MADDLDPNAPAPDAGGSSGEPSLRDTLEQAYETVETRDAPPPEDAPPGAKPAAAPAAAPTGEQPAPTGERLRDPATGKFLPGEAAPKAAQKPPAAPAAAPGAKAPPPAAGAPQKPQDALKPPAPDAAATPTRAPVSWKPAAREHWAKLPAEVQQEVIRRESEVARTLSESSKAREALTHVQQVLGPYAQNISATGRNALDAMGDLFRADNTLRHGTVQEKAALAADIIKSYGVDIVALDAILAGQQPEVDPNAAMTDRLRKEMQAQLQPVLGFFNQMQGRRQQQLQQINTDAAGEVETFATDGQHEFFEDVRADMADIIDLFTKRGHSITLQDAYERAIRINPQVSEIVAKRAEAERVNAQAAAAQRARRTAASIGGSPAPAGGPGPAGDDRRAAIESAWDQASGS